MITVFKTAESGTICLLFFLEVLILGEEGEEMVILPNQGKKWAFPSMKELQENNFGKRPVPKICKVKKCTLFKHLFKIYLQGT